MKFGQSLVLVPVHSITAFLATTLLVEKPQLLPSYIFFSMAWILMAAMDYRSKFPDVWSRCRTFTGKFYCYDQITGCTVCCLGDTDFSSS